jgi:hypothetical protein
VITIVITKHALIYNNMETQFFPNRRWLVIPTTITGSIEFNQVLQDSTGSLRLSVDGTQTFVKYEVTEVTESYTINFMNAETNESGSYTVEAGVYGRPSIYSPEYPEYNHEEILALLSTEAWTVPIDTMIP